MELSIIKGFYLVNTSIITLNKIHLKFNIPKKNVGRYLISIPNMF